MFSRLHCRCTALKEEGTGAPKKARVDWKAINVTAWMLAYADEVGDPMPDECLTTALEALVVQWLPLSLS